MTRRTQAERTAATVDALIDATLDCLSTDGFQGTSTRMIATRAGVSQGALQHHFQSKAALVDAAMNRLMASLLAPAFSPPDESASEEQRLVVLLDRIWDAFTRPVFGVVFEHLNLARTHPETAALTRATMVATTTQVHELTANQVPALAARPGFADDLDFVLGALRDAALIRHIGGFDDAATWETVRAIAVRLLSPSP